MIEIVDSETGHKYGFYSDTGCFHACGESDVTYQLMEDVSVRAVVGVQLLYHGDESKAA